MYATRVWDSVVLCLSMCVCVYLCVCEWDRGAHMHIGCNINKLVQVVGSDITFVYYCTHFYLRNIRQFIVWTARTHTQACTQTCVHAHIYLLFLSNTWNVHKSIQFKNKSYSDNNKHRGSAAPTDAQRELKWIEN